MVRPMIRPMFTSMVNPGSVVSKYDTIIGVGDSITDGEFKVNAQFDDGGLIPFRGVNFDSAATSGTTLQNMIDSIDTYTDLAVGRTLFVLRGGINDCNALLSSGGVGDGDPGTVTAWDDLSSGQKTLTEGRYRTLIALLGAYGDVALCTITYCDAKGLLLPLPDQGRSLHSGSWNDGIVIPLANELTPSFVFGGVPIFDYYNKVLEDPTILDADNLHFYQDRDYYSAAAGAPDGDGSFTFRNYLTSVLSQKGHIPALPFDSKFKNRVRINVGPLMGVTYRPIANRRGNNIITETQSGTASALVSYDDSKLDAQIDFSWNAASNINPRRNLTTNSNKWTEGLLDENALSCSSYVNTSITMTISNAKKGELSLCGLFYRDRINNDFITSASVTDDNGTSSVTYANSIINADGPLDKDIHVGKLSYDTTISGVLTITITNGSTGTYATIGALMIDIER